MNVQRIHLHLSKESLSFGWRLAQVKGQTDSGDVVIAVC